MPSRRVRVLLSILLVMIVGFTLLALRPKEDIEWDDTPGAGQAWRDQIRFWYGKDRVVEFAAYAPPAEPQERLSVLVYIGGVDAHPAWATRGPWAAFADAHRSVIIAPFFHQDLAELRRQESYQYPDFWSGSALERILEEVARRAPIDADEIYLFGFSAGAQFAHRYGLLHPDKVRAVVANAPGSVTLPMIPIDTRFLFMVGAWDTDRVPLSEEFKAWGDDLRIDVELEILPWHDHRLSRHQLERGRAFFTETKRRRAAAP